MRLANQPNSSNYLADVACLISPEGAAIATADPNAVYKKIHPLERSVMTRMTAQRRAEYSAGRIAAGDALAQLGIYDQPVIQGLDRAPIWPRGITGSISHTDKHCIAIIAKTNNICSIGIDIEPNRDLDISLIPEICGPKEISWLNLQPEEKRRQLARLIFSVKECAYKCQYPLTREIFGFDILQVEIDQSKSSFTATFMKPIGIFSAGYQIFGRYNILYDTILTTTYLPKTIIPAGMEL